MWANVLHIYQPSTQTEDIIHKVVKQCYGPLVDGLIHEAKARITLNVSASLSDWLIELGYSQIIAGFAQAAKRGQVEFLASAKFHPILPLIPAKEAKRQIIFNQQTNRRYFGRIYNPIGFFLPEMAYSREVGKLLADMGYRYVIMDEIGYAKNVKLPFDRLYSLQDYPDFKIFFRNRSVSDAISFGKIKNSAGFLGALKKNLSQNDSYLITALDGETFGHHRKGFDKILFAAFGQAQSVGIRAVLIQNFLKGMKGARGLKGEEDVVDPIACSWSSNVKDLAKGIPFALWQHPDNPVHQWQWKLVELALQEIKEQRAKRKNIGEDNFLQARELLDQGLQSDQFWWASGYELAGSKFVFWSPAMIERGARLLLESIASFADLDAETMALARDYYEAIGESTARFEKILKKRKVLK